jgi:hypothetical protein
VTLTTVVTKRSKKTGKRTRRTIRVAKGSFTIPAGQAKSLSMKLAKAARAALKKATGRKLKVTVAVAARDADGATATTGAKVTVRAATG